MFSNKMTIFRYKVPYKSIKFSSSTIQNNVATINQGEFKPRVFSAIQPTGVIHLGNYLGAVKQWVKLQDEGNDVLYSIADLHSMTLSHDPKTLSANILGVTAILFACGIDPKKSILFQQSRVYQHAELFWHLSCIATMARMSHFHQFKEKSAALKDVPLALFVYPVLQAADILLYKATHVPVGEDQFQHLELCQSLARMFNRRYGKTFPHPNIFVAESGSAKIKSLRDPTKKMSKSDSDTKSTILLTDSPDIIQNKIKKAVTDCNSKITFDPESRPGISSLISIHSLLTQKSTDQICEEAHALDTLQYKKWVSEVIINELRPIQQELSKLNADRGYLINSLQDGAERAIIIAEETAQEVRQKLGLKLDDLAKSVGILTN